MVKSTNTYHNESVAITPGSVGYYNMHSHFICILAGLQNDMLKYALGVAFLLQYVLTIVIFKSQMLHLSSFSVDFVYFISLNTHLIHTLDSWTGTVSQYYQNIPYCHVIGFFSLELVLYCPHIITAEHNYKIL